MWHYNTFTVNKYTVLLEWLRFGGKSTVVADRLWETLTTKYPILNKKTVDPAHCICFSLSQPHYWIWQINRFDAWLTLERCLALFLFPLVFFFFFQSPCFTDLLSHIPPVSYTLDSTSPIYDKLYMNVKEGGGKNWDLTDLGCTAPDKIKTPQWIRCSMLWCHCCCHWC